MLQSYSAHGDAYYEGIGQNPGLRHYLEILKRRALLLVVTFLVILLLGVAVTVIQHPVYQAEGKVLVESQAIPTDLVQPTVTASANERIQVIQQRIMTRENLLGMIKKYGMFPRASQWMSDTQLLDLMRERTKFALVDLNSSVGRPGNTTIAFTVSFDYESPETTLRVTNDLLTLILNEDARTRTARATETTEFLARESQRLQGALAAIDAQIAENRAKPQGATSETSDPATLQRIELTKLKEELAQKSAVYSDAHPVIIDLKRRITAMEKLIAETPAKPAAQIDGALYELERQRAEIAKDLEANNRKLEAARLGERLEKDQQAERLQVIEQPVLPQSPIKPNRMKLLAASFAFALLAGAAAVFAAESLDGSIRHSHELAAVSNGRLVVSIPYIATRRETARRRRRIALFAGIVLVGLCGGATWFVMFGPVVDLTLIKQFWIDRLTSLSK